MGSKATKITTGIGAGLILVGIVAFMLHADRELASLDEDSIDAPSGYLNDKNENDQFAYIGQTKPLQSDSASLDAAPPPPKESASSDAAIDTYLKAYRTATQPDPDDLYGDYSDLK